MPRKNPRGARVVGVDESEAHGDNAGNCDELHGENRWSAQQNRDPPRVANGARNDGSRDNRAGLNCGSGGGCDGCHVALRCGKQRLWL